MKKANLATGDYTVEGMEEFLAIERKGTISELANNLFSKDFVRFEKELERLALIDNAYIVLCFMDKDIDNYPYSAKLPYHIKKKIKVRGKFFRKRLNELMETYPTIHWVFAGDNGKQVILDIINECCNE